MGNVKHREIRKVRNMKTERNFLPILVAAILMLSMVLATLPMAKAQTMSIAIDPSYGPVGTKVTVTGTIQTYNGGYKILFDRDADGAAEEEEVLAEGTAVGYSVSKVVTIPDTYAGARLLVLKDVGTGATASALFTVEMAFSLEIVGSSVNYEGGPFALKATVTGGSKLWTDDDADTTRDVRFRFRVRDPTGTEIAALTQEVIVNEKSPPSYGKFVHELIYGPNEDYLVKWGDYTVLLDVDKDDDGNFETGELNLKSVSFTVRLTDKPEYGRTEDTRMKAYVSEAGDYYYKVYDPTGAEVASIGPITMTGAGFLNEETWASAKDSPLGTYTVKVVKGTTVVKSQTFLLKAAKLSIEFTSATTGDIERTYTATAEFYVKYPDNSKAGSLDIPTGFKVAVFYNKTKVTEISLDPLLNYNPATERWSVSWKIPKDARLGIRYAFNVTANTITDAYGNMGPEKYASSGEQKGFFNVKPATLTVTVPSLVYPAPGAGLQRTLEARASLKVTYPDGFPFTNEDLAWLNVTICEAGGASKYIVSLSAADYNPALGLWVARWKIPYNAPTTAYAFKVLANNVVDKFGNRGPQAHTPESSSFNVVEATITITNLKTNLAVYESGETVYVTFEAFYPSGDKVTKGTATVTIEPAAVTASAKYDAGLGKWLAYFTVPDTWIGRYNVTLAVNSLDDTAGNKGPTVKAWCGFSVAKVTVIEVVVDIGSSYFPGETATFFAIARLRGAPYDLPAEAFSATVYLPDGSTAPITATKLAPGLYKFSYTLPPKAPTGGYVAEVKVNYEVAPYTYARGFGITSFSVSPTLTQWDTSLSDIKTSLSTINARIVAINGTVATIRTDVGTIKTDVSAIRATVTDIRSGVATISTDVGTIKTDVSAIRPVITRIDGSVATISTDVGTIKVDVSAIRPVITEVKNGIATVSTDVGTIKGKVETIDGNVAVIRTDVGTIKAEILDVMDAAESAKVAAEAVVAPLYAAVVLALIAAIASIYSIIAIRRKIAG